MHGWTPLGGGRQPCRNGVVSAAIGQRRRAILHSCQNWFVCLVMAKRARSCERGCASTIMMGSGVVRLTGFCVASASPRPVSCTRRRIVGCFSELPNREIACPDDDSRVATNYGVILDEVSECTRMRNWPVGPRGYVDGAA